jgi:D-alanyl-D-alanine carboxypeptidase
MEMMLFLRLQVVNKMKKIKKILPILSVLVIFVVVTWAIYLNSDKLFLFFENSGIFLDSEPVKEVILSEGMAEHSFDQLKNDDRVTFDQSLMLINTENLLDEGFKPDVAEYKDTDVYMNACMLEAYATLSAVVTENFDKKLYVSDDFRTAEEQESLYIEMPDTATKPGASEHQAGLALDVYVAYFSGDGFIKSSAGRFVNSTCHEYGFIIRYPFWGEDVTGIRYEPWHIRYVGAPHAEIIYNNQLAFEEYIFSMEIGQWYEYDGYLICRQALSYDGTFMLPESFESCVISPDNTGYFIITIRK